MKRYLQFNVLLAAVILMVCGTASMSAQTKVTSLRQLKAGCVIKIYPKDSNGTSHYGENEMALACSGNGQYLTSCEKAKSGDSWTLVDAGDGYCYLKNNLGCYWAYQSRSSYQSLTCTTSQNSAVKISFTWDSTYDGVCFWNKEDGTGLNNLNGYGYRYNWWSWTTDYTSDANTTFDVAIVQEGSGEPIIATQEIVDNGIKYLLNLRDKTASVLPNDYGQANVIIPQSVAYCGDGYIVTSLADQCFDCCWRLTSVTLPDGITSLGNRCFHGTHLTSINLPNSITSFGDECFSGCQFTSIDIPVSVTSLGNGCFSYCRDLTSINLPNGITSLGNDFFSFCTSLTSVALPNSITSLGDACFSHCEKLKSIVLPEGITSLGDQCFFYCSSLEKITLPSTLENIGCDFLYGTEKKIIISCLASKPPTNKNYNAISLSSDSRLYVPQNSLEKYKSIYPWNTVNLINPLYPVDSVTLSANYSVEIAKTMKMDYAILPENAANKNVTWLSESPEIASVDADGTVTGNKVGTAKIVATTTDGTDVSAYTMVTVVPPLVVSMSFVDSTISLTKTKKTTVSLKITPADAGNKNMVWTSSDESVATVVQSADAAKPLEAIVTGHKVGKATIKAEAQDGSGVTATCEVEVTPLLVSDFAVKEDMVIKDVPKKLEIEFTPAEADNQNLKWTSLSPEIASITEDGVVTGTEIGRWATLKAITTDGSNIEKTFDVQVFGIEFKEPYLSVVKTKEANICMSDKSNRYTDQVRWTSSDESVATVTPDKSIRWRYSAIVSAKKVGKTIIKIEATDGSGMSATCEVEVMPLPVSNFTTNTSSVVKTVPTKMEMDVTPAEADNQNLKWTSLSPEIATITEDGTATGLKMGIAKLQAATTDGSNISKTFDVQVLGLPVSTISLPIEASIVKTEKQKLSYTVLPAASDNQALKWSSNAPAIASVDETSGVISAHKVGNAIITATATDGSGISASTTIHVTPLKVNKVTLSNETLKVLWSTTETLTATVTPELADNKTLKWASDNENVATVTQKGVVKGVNVGTANITATTTDGGNVSATCKVTVTPVTIDLSTKTINLRKGESYAEQVVNVLPEGYEHKEVSWSSTDNSVASVSASGVITAVKPGITTIKYALDYDNNISAECKVIVYDANVVYVGGIYYILDKTAMLATVTSIYGGKNTSLDANNVAQYYSGTINIPETIIYDGSKYTVKYVGSYAFNCQNELQSIIVPRTVTAFRANAAIKAENLNRVNVANESQLDSIGKQAFMECTGLRRFTFDGTSLFMNIIDKEAFKNCTSLERVTWTDDTSIKIIGYGAFYGCSALEKVQWLRKSELKTIQDYAFFRCVSLNNFEMPNTTLSVGNSSFRYNSSLTSIHLSTSLNYIDEYAFGECGFSQITLPESLANIQAGAFINNEYLQEITLPERLQGLGSAAFENNSALESVTFHTAIETMTIGSNAFNLCPMLNKVYITNLNSFAQTNFNNAKANPANTSQHIYDANGKEIINVVLPKGTKYVNNNAFNGCAYIESIEMPATMDHVNDDIFYDCSALKDVYCYAEDVPDFIGVNDPSNMAAIFKQSTLHVPFGSEAKYQKDKEWWGRFGSIKGCDPQPTQVVEKIDLSTRTVNLKRGTAYNEQKITISPAEAANVRIKYSTANRNVADIDENGVIHGVAAGVTTITYTANDGSGVTADCKVIVREPEVEYVGDLYYLFDKGKKEATVTSIYGGKNTSLNAEKVAQYYTGTVNIPEQTTFDATTYDVKTIGGYAFTCQNDLQALRIGAFVEEIADNAAAKALNLNRITVANASHLKNIGKEAFMDCAGLQHVLFEGTTNSMEAIGEAAFKNCTALHDVIWEGQSTLKVIGNSAFYACGKLETVKWNDLCTLQTISDYAFYKCSSLNHFLMPNSTLSVGKYSFRYDEALTDIQLSTSLSIIYDYAFGECGFSQIVLPESLKSLQAGAFINNSYLADVTIPKKLEGIGAGAFENNDALETVTFKTHETKLTVDKNAFNFCPVLSRVNIDYLDDWAHINFQNAAANPTSTAHRLYLNNEEIVDVNLPVGTKYIGNNAFNGCTNIRTLVVPATVEHINDNVIYGSSALRDVYCYATKVPQFIGTEDPSAMSDVFSQATLHVVYGNEAAYKADAWWGRFYKVEGCDAPSDEDVKVTSITISQAAATLKPNDTMQLEATVYPTNAANKKILWKSSNEDVAIVTDEGFVLAVAEGEADITAEAADGSGITATCHVTVENEKQPVVPIVEIKFEVSPVTIAVGESYKLNVIFKPVDATNKKLVWKSAMPSVVSVDDEGTVVGLTEGKSIVSAKTTDGSNLTINCVVNVTRTTGIGGIAVGDVRLIVDERHLTVEGLAEGDVIYVANVNGFTVYKGAEHEVDLGAAGVYIIKVKGKTLKFSVK